MWKCKECGGMKFRVENVGSYVGDEFDKNGDVVWDWESEGYEKTHMCINMECQNEGDEMIDIATWED